MRAWLRRHLIFWVILSIGTLLRAIALLRSGDFSFDEMFSFVYSQKPWLQSLTRFWPWETNPPLHLLLLKLWFYVAPATEFTARFPSFLLGTASLGAFYVFASRRFPKRTVLLTAALLALSPVHIFYSATARTYSLLILLSILQVHYFWKIFLEERVSRRTGIVYCLVTTLLLYCHLTGIIVILSEGLALLIAKRHALARWLAALITPFLLFAPWIILSLAWKLNSDMWQHAWFFRMQPGWSSYLLMPSMMLWGGPRVPLWYNGAALAMFIGLIALSLWQQTKKRHNSYQTATAWLTIFCLAAIPLGIAMAASLIEIKFFFISLPWCILLFAGVFAHWLPGRRLPYLTAALFAPGLIGLYLMLPINDWSKLAALINERYRPDRPQLIMMNSFIGKNELERYVKTPLPRAVHAPDTALDWDRFVIIENYQKRYETASDTARWMTPNNLKSTTKFCSLNTRPPASLRPWT